MEYKEVNINALSDAAIAVEAGVVKSQAFGVDSKNAGHVFRLNFSGSPDEMIVKETEILGKITKEFCHNYNKNVIKHKKN